MSEHWFPLALILVVDLMAGAMSVPTWASRCCSVMTRWWDSTRAARPSGGPPAQRSCSGRSGSLFIFSSTSAITITSTPPLADRGGTLRVSEPIHRRDLMNSATIAQPPVPGREHPAVLAVARPGCRLPGAARWRTGIHSRLGPSRFPNLRAWHAPGRNLRRGDDLLRLVAYAAGPARRPLRRGVNTPFTCSGRRISPRMLGRIRPTAGDYGVILGLPRGPRALGDDLDKLETHLPERAYQHRPERGYQHAGRPDRGPLFHPYLAPAELPATLPDHPGGLHCLVEQRRVQVPITWHG